MKLALIANPYSRGRVSAAIITRVQARFEAARFAVDLMVTRHHEHGMRLLDGLDLDAYDAVVAMGGDGTNYHVLNGVLNNSKGGRLPAMGIIPVGRGNSFARDLNIFTMDEGIDAVLGARTRPVDVCTFSQNRRTLYFVNLMGFGFVTDVACTAARFSRTGDFSYILGVLHRVLGLKSYVLDLEIDGKQISGPNCFVEFCNSRYTGGDMLMAPAARIDDGLFDVVVAGPISRLGLVATLPKLFKGRHGENPAVSFYQGQRARAKTTPTKDLLPDGEIFGQTPTEVRILPKRVNYFYAVNH
ncbi:MAG: diacylglycerol kinase family lipid kinase [Desulfobacterales bacterium]|nr:diacylglycerol kinase family lipid kinase [Desulfobacterales bacterium]